MTLDSERLRQLGRVAAAAAELEFYLYALTCEMSGDDVQTAQKIVGHPSFSELAKFAEKQLEARGLEPPLGEQFRQMLRIARGAMEERNQILHSHWVSDTTQARLDRRKIPGVRLELSAADIEDVAGMLESAANGMNFLWVEIVIALDRLQLVDGVPRLTDWTGLPSQIERRPREEHPPQRWGHAFLSGSAALSASLTENRGSEGSEHPRPR